MEQVRKPGQGIKNIFRFNWHYYAIAILFIIFLLLISNCINNRLAMACYLASFIIVSTILISLIVSYYIYDHSGLYRFGWIIPDELPNQTVVNITAGYDETSPILFRKFPNARLVIFDFYNPSQHTEVSIKRARAAYPSYPGTQIINTMSIPLPNAYADKIFLIFAAHEIRNMDERIFFFKEINRVLKNNGCLYVTEHLRDVPNFLTYNIGFFHFFSRASWLKVFTKTRFVIKKEFKTTFFISNFILQKDGTTL